MDGIAPIVEAVVALESLLLEYDQWYGRHYNYVIRLDLLRKFGPAEITEEVQAIDEAIGDAAAMLKGIADKIISDSDSKSVELARIKLTQLKTLLNQYMEASSSEFSIEHGLEFLSTEKIIELGMSMLEGESASD